MKITLQNSMLIALAAGMICLLVFLRALTCDFINFDDQEYILSNVAIRKLDLNFLSWAFSSFSPVIGAWIPLGWISFAIDYRLWGGLNPVGFHLTSILLHATNTALVVLIADSLLRDRVENISSQNQKIWYPFMLLLSGLLFGLHPLRVETAVWVSERMGVLSSFFSLGSIFLYICHARRQGSGIFSRMYIVSLVAFICSLMTKPVGVVVPLLLLVIDWYPLGRLQKGNIRQALIEKIPFIFLSAVLTIATFALGVSGGGLIDFERLDFGKRVVLAGNAIFEYCRLTLYPLEILPFRIITLPIPSSFTLKTIAVLAGLCICIAAMIRKHRFLPATVLCFLIPLIPTLSFFQTTDFLYAPRYTYLPSVALSIAAAYGILTGMERLSTLPNRIPFYLAGCMTAIFMIFLVAVTYVRIGDWQNSATVWTRIIAYQPYSKPFFLRGLYHMDTNNCRAAAEDFTECIRYSMMEGRTDTFNLYAFRGEAYTCSGRFVEAVNDLTAAISISPHPLYFYHRGLAYKGLGQSEKAEEDFRKAGDEKGVMRGFLN